MKNKSRNVVCVIGPGRSGTSLAMQVLEGFGLSVSSNLVESRYHNPQGPMEDVEIADIYDSLLIPLVGSNRCLPFPWDDLVGLDSEVEQIRLKLTAVLEKHLSATNKIWGFKEPYTSLILPMWFRVFNKAGVVPKLIFCTRNPSSVVVSRKRSFGNANNISELSWLNSTVSPLYDSGADVFILHYEDWFERLSEVGAGLLRFTGLDASFEGDIDQLLNKVVLNELNRSGTADYKILNPFVNKLYTALQECHGADFDRDALMAVVKECRQVMDGFKGWYELAHQANKKLAKIQLRLKTANAEAAKVKQLEARIKELEQESAQSALLRKQVQRLLNQLQWIEMQNEDAAQPVPISQ
jgi:hypothetical protein